VEWEGGGGGGGRGGGGTGDVAKMRKKTLTGSTVLRICTEFCAVFTIANNLTVHEDSQYDSVN